LACGWLIAIRVLGVLMPAFTLAGLLFYWWRAGVDSARRKRLLLYFTAYAVLLTAFTVLFWPTLWRSPWASFRNALQVMSQYPWPQRVLYGGRLVPATELPWHYAPVWIAITTPVVYLVGFGLGIVAVLIRVFRRERPRQGGDFFPALILLWFASPVVAVIVLRSVLYDGWRHLYFVYPALLLISVEGYLTCYRVVRERARPWLITPLIATAAVAIGLSLAAVAAFMVTAEPDSSTRWTTGGSRIDRAWSASFGTIAPT
jgi:hypothetical protein